MFRRILLLCAAGIVLLAAPATASAEAKLEISFEKDCPEYTCTGTLLDRAGAPLAGSLLETALTPLWFKGGMLGYSAQETIMQGDSRFTMSLRGIANYNVEPDATSVIGRVVEGSWLDRPLTGALVRGSAERVAGTTFRGVLVITPPQ